MNSFIDYLACCECFQSLKWIRVELNGQIIADSRKVKLARIPGQPPIYFFPRRDVKTGYLMAGTNTEYAQNKSQIRYWDIEIGSRRLIKAAWEYVKPEENNAPITGHIAFKWNSMDAWYEEQEEVFVHPRDPYVRIDVLASTRHIEVIVLGEKVADTRTPALLFETGLQARYYIPKIDVRLDLLVPTEHLTRCPYKGEAKYYSVNIGDHTAENIAWHYRYPTLEASRITSMISFFNERVDAIYVDGELQEKEDI